MSSHLKKSLPDLLKKRKLSLARLSSISKVPKSTLHSWVSGQSSVNLDQLKSVAAALEVSVFQLAYGEDSDPFASESVEILENLFIGDVRLSISRIKRR